ncbi:MAG: hypothetical protein DCC67_05015 [Planctomycetota bacterium]|nr:MAG: hypothetical protein DCC67_05015 [Planctomycetota bacterium]
MLFAVYVAACVSAHAVTFDHTSITAGAVSYTTADAKVTLTPFAAGGGAGAFGPTSGCCIGVNGGTNNGGVDDADGKPDTAGDRERLDITLSANVWLNEIGFIFTRANGPLPTDGIVISGFLSDPAATLDPAAASAGVTSTYDSGTLYVNHGWRGGAVSVVSFANAGASLGRTLSIAVNDSNEASAQAVVNQLSYTVVPEPSAFVMAGIGALVLGARRAAMRNTLRDATAVPLHVTLGRPRS